MGTVLAIDPGPTRSALVEWDGQQIGITMLAENLDIVTLLRCSGQRGSDTRVVIEQVVSYGMTVGAEVFETCVWTGRFIEAFGPDRVDRIPRLRVKIHHCHAANAKDSNIRQALIDRWGGKECAIGRKAGPGPLYALKADLWQAFALAVHWWDTRVARETARATA
jgi:hypothetical protein